VATNPTGQIRYRERTASRTDKAARD
jgi:hypothetical protein